MPPPHLPPPRGATSYPLGLSPYRPTHQPSNSQIHNFPGANQNPYRNIAPSRTIPNTSMARELNHSHSNVQFDYSSHTKEYPILIGLFSRTTPTESTSSHCSSTSIDLQSSNSSTRPHSPSPAPSNPYQDLTSHAPKTHRSPPFSNDPNSSNDLCDPVAVCDQQMRSSCLPNDTCVPVNPKGSGYHGPQRSRRSTRSNNRDIVSSESSRPFGCYGFRDSNGSRSTSRNLSSARTLNHNTSFVADPTPKPSSNFYADPFQKMVPNLNVGQRKTKQKRQPKTIFTQKQLDILQDKYEKHYKPGKRLSPQLYGRIALDVGEDVTGKIVQNWFAHETHRRNSLNR